MRVGVLRNPMSHANRGHPSPPPADLAAFAEPASTADVAAELARFAEAGVELLVIDGGDGTVREALSSLPQVFRDRTPLITLIPSGKTNILAFDVGIRRGRWTLDAARAAAAQATPRVRRRQPLRVRREGSGEDLQGFVFGAAGLVRATALASGIHRVGVFQNASVGLTLAGAVGEALGGDAAWRRGEILSLSVDGEPTRTGPRLVTMATTLERLPFAMRPFGRARSGLKYLDADAPARTLPLALPAMIWSRADAWLERRGYRRGLAGRLDLDIASDVVLDGEVYPGGRFTITEAPALAFLTP